MAQYEKAVEQCMYRLAVRIEPLTHRGVDQRTTTDITGPCGMVEISSATVFNHHNILFVMPDAFEI